MEDEELDLETYEMISRDEENREIPENSKKGKKKKANNLDWVIDAVSRYRTYKLSKFESKLKIFQNEISIAIC